MSEELVIRVNGLTRRFRSGGDEIAPINDYDLTLYAGELVAVVGRSGSGKTTLLNLLGGWEQADAGVIEFRGASCDPALLDWSQLATVPQAPGLLDELTVRENVGLPLLIADGATWKGVMQGKRVSDLLAWLGLSRLADRRPSETSLGEQQRCSVARGLVQSPALLLADEPTAHQDALMVEAVLGALSEAVAAGTCCVVATHSPEVLDRADRVIALG